MTGHRYLPASTADTSPETNHRCKKLNGPSGLRSFAKAWWHFPIHILWSVTVTTIVLGLLNKRAFPVRRTPGYRLTQSDVSTLISVALKATSIICSSMQSALAWRCAFVALEQMGLTFSQLSAQVSFKFGPWWPRSKLATWISIALFLALPAQLAPPFLSGAVTWVPYEGLQTQDSRLIHVATPSPDYDSNWAHLTILSPLKESPGNQVIRGSGATIINMAADKSNGKEFVTTPRRYVPELRGIPVGSTLSNITMPYMKISDFSWLNTLESVPQDVKSAIEESDSNWFNYSRQLNPLYSFPGTVAMARKNNFTGIHRSELPMPVTVSTQTYVALYAFDHNITRDSLPNCSYKAETRPADPPVHEYLRNNAFNDRSCCYAVGKLTFEAGVVTCRDSATIIAESLAECRGEQTYQLQPDPLVQFALNLVPETIMRVVILNNTGWDFRDGSEIYAKNILNMAYQGVWSSMVYFTNGNEMLSSEVYERVDAAQADVTPWRVWLWLFLNMLITMAGIMVYLLQMQAVRPVVKDPVLAMAMMDPKMVYEDGTNNVCDIDNLRSSDKRELRLWLQSQSREDGQWHHDRLRLQAMPP